MRYLKIKMAPRWLLILVLVCLVTSPLFAATQTPLLADRAFEFSVTVKDSRVINAHWKIAPGYYLYKQRLHFSFIPKVIADIRLPQGQLKEDPLHRPYEVYANELRIPIVLQKDASTLQLNVEYQGCSKRGFCYPPIQKKLTLDMQNKIILPTHELSTISIDQISLQSLLTDQHQINVFLHSYPLSVMLLIFVGLGVLLAFTPCVLPMIPILTSIIAGHQQPINATRGFWLSSTYVLGASITYALAGVLAAYLGHSLQAWLQQPWIIAATSAMFALLAFSLFGLYSIQLPRNWQNWITTISRQQKGGTYIGVFIMGVISTLIISPCVTAPLVGVLMYIAQTGNMVLGASILFAMSMGMGIPLILIGTSAGKWLPKRGPWMNGVQYILGVLMLVVAVGLLARVYSFTTIATFCAILLLGGAIFWGIYGARLTKHPLLNRSLGLVAALSSVLLLISVNTSFISTHFTINHSQPNPFTIVHNIKDLNRQLAMAQVLGKPVILDFYADWCESCVEMDRKIFNSPVILNSLKPFVLLRADLSENNTDDEMLLKNYDVIAPPTLVFFNNQGQEVSSRRIVGGLSAEDFMTRITTFITASCDKNTTC